MKCIIQDYIYFRGKMQIRTSQRKRYLGQSQKIPNTELQRSAPHITVPCGCVMICMEYSQLKKLNQAWGSRAFINGLTQHACGWIPNDAPILLLEAGLHSHGPKPKTSHHKICLHVWLVLILNCIWPHPIISLAQIIRCSPVINYQGTPITWEILSV